MKAKSIKYLPNKVSVYGVIIATNWDEQFIPSEFSLFTEEGEEILINSNPKLNKKLIKLLNCNVNIIGVENFSKTHNRCLKPYKIVKEHSTMKRNILPHHLLEKDSIEII